MALTISRLAPLTDDVTAPTDPAPPAGPDEASDAEVEARLQALVDELNSRKPEITALAELKAKAEQSPQNRHARRALEAKMARG